MKQEKARELAQRFGVRMCDENGMTHGEELYCLGLDDIIAMKEALAKQEHGEPLDTPLPCDVKVGHVNIRKGVALRTLVARMQVLYDMAQPKQEQGEPTRKGHPQDAGFELWWAQYIPNATQSQAISAWNSAQPKQEQGEPLEYWNAVEGWVKLDEVREHFDSVNCATIYKNGGEGRVPLYTTPQQRKPLTDEQKDKMQRAYLQSPSPNDWWLMSEEDRQVEAYLQGVKDTEAAHGIKE